MCLKKSSVICFIGTDGSGKSTLVRETAKAYEKLFGVKTKSLYFGWKPFLPTTKLISYLFKKKGYRIAESMNKKKGKFSIFQEIMLFYYYIEYLMRYLFNIGFGFWKKQIIIVDRYFYDMYAHYGYAKKSVLFKLLMKLFPKPDFVFFLNIDVKDAKKRKPEMDIGLLQIHKSRYDELSKIMHLKIIHTKENIKDSVESVVNHTKEKISKRIK